MERAKTVGYKLLMQLLHFAIVLIGISFLTFSIMFLSPRNPAELWLAGSDGNLGTISEEAIERQEHIMGLDRPFLVQYGTWLGKRCKETWELLYLQYTSDRGDWKAYGAYPLDDGYYLVCFHPFGSSVGNFVCGV